ncbi:uncharacterized protein LOC123668883 [Melitaea cinxia]|uniref:uncharacterized protein LOC123668883 n=1 Tax=Melitaea cinxia TaxID=113334 RepID=UPI001E27255D|nr:uncharacterized protein LOC123668883 [Melitaea cinxia]
MIEKFFDNLSLELENVPPENIFNFDETGFHDDPKKQKLLFRRLCRNPEIIRNSTKSCFTVMFCGNAAGEFVPLYVIYKAQQKWSDWILDAPRGTRMAVTPTGWIDANTFDDWCESTLLPVLKKKEGKKVVLGDNLSSHITPKSLRLCAENNIKFICLVPNSTHLLQPLDVSYFSALKSDWRSILRDWRNTKRGKIVNVLPKPIFAKLLSKTVEKGQQTAGQNVIAGFKACGIYPLDRSMVLERLKEYSKPEVCDEVRESIGESFKNYIAEIRDKDLQMQQTRKFQIPVVAGKSVSVEEVEKYYEEREKKKSEKGQKKQKEKIQNKSTAPVKKRGRPLGSKSKGKTVQTSQHKPSSPVASPSELQSLQTLDTSATTSSAISPKVCNEQSLTSAPAETSLNHRLLLDASKSPTPGTEYSSMPSHPSPVGDSLLLVSNPPSPIDKDIEIEETNQSPAPRTDSSMPSHPSPVDDNSEIELETLNDDLVGEYEVRESVLCKTDKAKPAPLMKLGYCVFTYESILFPGRILTEDGHTVTISVMQKTVDGWKLPSKPERVTCSIDSVITRLEDTKISKLGNFYTIDNDFLSMEWGD